MPPPNPASSTSATFVNSDLYFACLGIFYDVLPDTDPIALPLGVGVQVITNAAQPSGGGPRATDGYLRAGAVVFDATGRVAYLRPGFVFANDGAIGLAVNGVAGGFDVAFNNTNGLPNPPKPVGGSPPASYPVPQPLPTSYGLVVYDRDAFANQNFPTVDPTFVAAGSYGTVNGSPKSEADAEAWLDVNATPLLVNRYNGDAGPRGMTAAGEQGSGGAGEWGSRGVGEQGSGGAGEQGSGGAGEWGARARGQTMNDRSTIAVVRRRRRSASRRPSAPLLPCPPAPLLPLPSAPRLRRGGGFSFAEVLFAVIILGIGFILVAAIFPVAIQQTQATVDDAAAAVAARGAASVIAAVPTTIPNPVYLSSPTAAQLSANPAVAVRQLLLFPPTVKNFIPTNIPPQMAADVPPPAIVVPFTGPRAALVAGNLINATDPRFAYVPFYRRENRSTTAQLIVIAIAARNRPVYDSTVDAAVPGPTTPMTGYAGPGGVITAHGTGVTDQVVSDQFTFSLTPPAWVCEGCALATNSASGRAYRLGRALSLVSPPKSFELDAGDASSVAAGPDGLWGTADDIRDVVGNFNGVLPPSTVPAGRCLRANLRFARLYRRADHAVHRPRARGRLRNGDRDEYARHLEPPSGAVRNPAGATARGTGGVRDRRRR